MNANVISLPSRQPDPVVEGEPIVEIKNLNRRFGRKQALQNVSLTIPRGVVMGLVGLNGAGKTTLLKHILGTLRAQAGSVSVFGEDPSRNPEYVLSKIGYLTEEDSLPSWMKVWQILKFSKSFYPGWDSDYAQELLETFKLEPSKTIGKMSKGQRARVGLTIALAHRPEFLVLDEPSSGLDPVVRNDILAAIIRTIAESGKTVLFSSHLLDEVQRVSDLVGVIRNGELVECGTLDSLQVRYQRVTLTFVHEERSNPPPIDALGNWERFGNDWSAVVDLDNEDFEKQVAALGAEVVNTQGISLNDWFLNSSRS